jgi:hypothetical protein
LAPNPPAADLLLCLRPTVMFDAYHKWMGIPTGRRPPTHYQLLGIAADEQDAEVIKEAALRQTAHVRVYQTGPHAELCTRLLNEIAQARAVLLNPKQREEYDAGLARATPAAEAQAVPMLVRKLRGVRPERVFAAVGYVVLLLVGFGLGACIAYQSQPTVPDDGRSAAPARGAPLEEHAP